jgi:hypothetical protein
MIILVIEVPENAYSPILIRLSDNVTPFDKLAE